MPKRVFIVVFEGFQLLDATGPAQVFATANDESHAQGQTVPRYRLSIASSAGGPVTSSAGIELGSSRLPPSRSAVGSTVIVAGGPGIEDAMRDATLTSWLGDVAAKADRVCSVCTGAYLLASCGLLDGRSAVTHWRHIARLQQLFPGVRVAANAIFVKSGNVYTSAGVTTGIDLCLALVRTDYGKAIAASVAKRLVVHMQRPGGQLQFSSELLAQSCSDSRFEDLVQHVKGSLPLRWSAAEMASRAGMTPRTFHRHFVAAFETTPSKFLRDCRIEKACTLIEESASSLKSIARATGFGTEVNMKNAFTQRLHTSPTEYRARFRPGNPSRP